MTSEQDGQAIRRGAVLYDRRPKTRRLDPVSERGLVHVTGVYEETTTGNRLIKIQDGTHTHYQMLHAVDLRDSFVPAGWSFPVGRKPTYHLTRNCGVDDEADLMTDGGAENHLGEAPDFEFDKGQSFKLAHVEEPEEYWYVKARVWNYDADTDDALVQLRAYKQYLVGEVSTLGGDERLVTEDTLMQQYEPVDKETASEVLHS